MLRIIFSSASTKKTGGAPVFSGGLPVFFAPWMLSGPGFFPLVRRQFVRFWPRKKQIMPLANGLPAGLFCRKYLVKFTGGTKDP